MRAMNGRTAIAIALLPYAVTIIYLLGKGFIQQVLGFSSDLDEALSEKLSRYHQSVGEYCGTSNHKLRSTNWTGEKIRRPASQR